ncbi:MAG: hypothetical protein R3C28_00405 [Pirellulaceae bacterium]
MAETDEAFVAELERIASIERDATGDVVAIEIQGVFIKADTIRRMRAFAPNLKHLRIDIAYQSDEALDEIGKWPKLESLEIPAYLADAQADDSSIYSEVLPFKSLAKLTRLKRLQLPFDIFHMDLEQELGEFTYHPERLVIPEFASFTLNVSLDQESFLTDLVFGDDVYDETGELQSLQNLEYLFLPGYICWSTAVLEWRRSLS